MLSTKREPSALCVPKLPLRQSTPGRIALSAVLLVGSTPSTWTNVHNASRRFKISWHVPAVLVPHSDCPLPTVAPLLDAVGSSRTESSSVAASRRAPDATSETSGVPGPARRHQALWKDHHDR